MVPRIPGHGLGIYKSQDPLFLVALEMAPEKRPPHQTENKKEEGQDNQGPPGQPLHQDHGPGDAHQDEGRPQVGLQEGEDKG